MSSSPFHFKKFSIFQEGVAQSVGTDGVLLGAWADTTSAKTILDIGTGTGLIALMLAQRTAPDVKITAIDLHRGSVECACENVKRSLWCDRIAVIEASVQEFAASPARQYDLIVSNPPFFSELTISPNAARNVARHTATLSIGDLIAAVKLLLAPGGKCCLILPEKEGKRLCEESVPLGLYCTSAVQVLSRAGKPVERLLLQLERDPGRFSRESFVIYGQAGEYSAVYKALTQDFYL